MDVLIQKTVAKATVDKIGGDGGADLSGDTTNIIQNVIAVLGLVCVVVMVVGGINYMTSNGDATKVEKGKKTVFGGLVGLIVCGLAFTIVNFAISIIPQDEQSSQTGKNNQNTNTSKTNTNNSSKTNTNSSTNNSKNNTNSNTSNNSTNNTNASNNNSNKNNTQVNPTNTTYDRFIRQGNTATTNNTNSTQTTTQSQLLNFFNYMNHSNSPKTYQNNTPTIGPILFR